MVSVLSVPLRHSMRRYRPWPALPPGVVPDSPQHELRPVGSATASPSSPGPGPASKRPSRNSQPAPHSSESLSSRSMRSSPSSRRSSGRGRSHRAPRTSWPLPRAARTQTRAIEWRTRSWSVASPQPSPTPRERMPFIAVVRWSSTLPLRWQISPGYLRCPPERTVPTRIPARRAGFTSARSSRPSPSTSPRPPTASLSRWQSPAHST